MVQLDDKQKRLVTTWIDYGTRENSDNYSRFISLWVAFNATCYALYAKYANKNRPDLDKDHGLAKVTSDPEKLAGKIFRESNRVKLEIDRPGKIAITITQKYTEDVIYAKFAKEFKSQYRNWLADQNFESKILALREAIKKGDRYYVINMIKISEHKTNSDYYEEMKRRNIIVAFEDKSNLEQLKDVMYQVRNNVFHGEKVPDDPNDDQIVKKAHPVLLSILKRMVPECAGSN
ncbi:MAG: hypothetical protein AB7T38_08095 [Nitrospirales bacterium]